MPRVPRSLTHALVWALALGAVTFTARTPSAIAAVRSGPEQAGTAPSAPRHAGPVRNPSRDAGSDVATDSVIHSFGAGSDGSAPFSTMIADSGGSLYGTTSSQGGGCSSCGMVFRLMPSGSTYSESPLYRFTGPPNDGYQPHGGLVADGSGNLYGATYLGGNGTGHPCSVGCGVVFKLKPVGSGFYAEKLLYAFKGGRDGAFPGGSLIVDARGHLYGTTNQGGASGCGAQGCGTVFELSPVAGGLYKERVLWRFTGLADGGHPYGSVLRDKAGALYGTARDGGFNYGVVYKLIPAKPSYKQQVLYSFAGSPDGQYPLAGLVADSTGSLYGTTENGGTAACNCGTFFKLLLTKSGMYFGKILYSFSGGPSDGANPQAELLESLVGSNLLFYTTTTGGGSSGYGTVVRLEPAASGLYKDSVLHSFTGMPKDGNSPFGGVVFGKGGDLYGTTDLGGIVNSGTAYSVKPPPPPTPTRMPRQQRETGSRSRSTALGSRTPSLPSCAVGSGAVCTQPFYDLGEVTVGGINNVGNVVGTATNGSGFSHASIFNEYTGLAAPLNLLAHGVTDLGALNGSSNSSTGNAISDLWNSSGFINNPPTPYAAGQSNLQSFRWTNGSMASIGARSSNGYGIDLQGDVTGQTFNASQNEDFAITWLSSGGPVIPFPPTRNGPISAGQAITVRAAPPGAPVMFAGYETTKTGSRGFLYDQAVGGLSYFAPLPGDVDVVPRALSPASALIVGNSQSAARQLHAFAVPILPGGKAGVAFALPTLGGAQSFARAVGGSGYIVGYAQDGSGASRATVWKPIGGATKYVAIDLNTLGLAPTGWLLTDAYGVNDRNQIVGYGTNDGGQTSRGFLLLMNRHVVDVSTKTLTSFSVDALAYLGYDLVIQELWAPLHGQLVNAARNLRAINSAGYKNAVYVFLQFNDPTNQTGSVQMQEAVANLGAYISAARTSFLVLDVEFNCATPSVPTTCFDGTHNNPPITQQQRTTIIANAIGSTAAPGGIPVMIYTSRSAWASLVGLKSPNQKFSNCLLWDAKPDNISDLALTANDKTHVLMPFSPYGVWANRAAKQYEAHNAKTIEGEDILGIEAFAKAVASPVSVDVSSFDWSFFSMTSPCVTGSTQ